MSLRWTGNDLPLRRIAARALARLTDSAAPAARGAFDDPDAATSVTLMIARQLDPPDAPFDGARALVTHLEAIERAARDALSSPQGIDRVLDALSVAGRFTPLTGESGPLAPDAVEASRALLRALTPALAQLVTHPDAALRRRVLQTLALSDAPEAADALARAAEDGDAAVSEAALSLLASRAGGAATPANAAQHLEGSNPWKTRLAAAAALERSDAPESAEALERALAADPLSIVRATAARSLARRAADPGVRSALERAARDDVDASVREAAAQGLGIR